MNLLSVIVPCYNEGACVEAFYQEVTATLKNSKFEYELIFVDDGSCDGTVDKLLKITQGDIHTTVIEFSRNFGKESALSAGLKVAKGDMIVPIDADLQHPPKVILEMVDLYSRGGGRCSYCIEKVSFD